MLHPVTPRRTVRPRGAEPGWGSNMRLKRTSRHNSGPRSRRVTPRASAFTLLEALMASTLLGVIVIAVVSAITSAQRLSFEGQKRVLAAMAADDLMLELVTLPYAQLQGQNGLAQPPGSLVTLDGQVYPDSFWALGRAVQVVEETIENPDLGVNVRGLRVTVSTYDSLSNLLSIETFVPEPAG